MGKHSLVLGVMVLTSSTINAINILQEIKARPNLSQAYDIIQFDDTLYPYLLESKGCTAFIPSNMAISQYQGDKNDAIFISYHLANIPYRVQELPSEINSYLMGNPKLYVSKIPSGKPPTMGWEDIDYYINNAKITYANVNATTNDGDAQVLHIVDQVITATFPDRIRDVKYLNPNVKTLISKPEIYGIKDRDSISKFEKQVKHLKMMDVFDLSGSSTFFIPVNNVAIDMMDKEDVYGHIIPNRVLFTRTVQRSENYPAYAFTDNMMVRLSIEKIQDPDDEADVFYVLSKMKNSGNAHKSGSVLARIVHGNIPVKNGVVHIIDRPLKVVSSSINSYLQEEDRQLSLFYELLKHYRELTKQLAREKAELTLFAPSNNAFNLVDVNRFRKVKLNKEKLGNLLKLHIVPQILTTDMIINKNPGPVETLSNHHKLYFSINDSNPSNPIVVLDDAGVKAAVMIPNIPAKNGAVHIIDRILGIPYETVYEKLLTEPTLSYTANLSMQEEWNLHLDNQDKKFTFFAPSNNAWNYIKREMPSDEKKRFLGEFSDQVRHILQRHLIVGSILSLDELSHLTTNAPIIRGNLREEKLQMINGTILFQAKSIKHYRNASYDNEDSYDDIGYNSKYEEYYVEEYYVEWNGIQAKVIRSDIECVNGVIHVIDQVLMMKGTSASMSLLHLSLLDTFILSVLLVLLL